MRSRWPWVLVLVGAPVIVLLTFGIQVGRCVDHTAESGLASFCESGPVVGWPGAVVVTVLCTGLSVLAIAMLMRRAPGPDWAFTVEDGPPHLTNEQTVLLVELDRVLTRFAPEPEDPEALIAAVRPILTALRASGLTPAEIAGRGALRFDTVKRILD